jgi:hypothetical protein
MDRAVNAALFAETLAVSGRPGLPDAALMHEREVELEARSPVLPTLGVLAT